MFCIYIADYIWPKQQRRNKVGIRRGYKSKTVANFIDGEASGWYTVLTCCLTQGNLVLLYYLYKRGYPEGVLS